MCEFEGWVTWLEPAYLLWKPGGRGYEIPPYMTWTEQDKPKLTPEEELAKMTKEVNESHLRILMMTRLNSSKQGYVRVNISRLTMSSAGPNPIKESNTLGSRKLSREILRKLSREMFRKM